MAAEKSPRSKTQTLSLRLDPKTRFVLEFLAKFYRRNITTVVEDAIKRAGDVVRVKPGDQNSRTWRDYWDVSEGVRAMRMLADPDIPSDYADDERRTFIEWHIEFFSDTNELANPERTNVDILWPKIDQYVEDWHESKRIDPWAVGLDMVDDLQGSNVKPPQWPRDTKEPPKPKTKTADFSSSLDDEVPF